MKKIFFASFILLLAGTVFSQTPRLAYVYPAGGKAGTMFQIVIGGQSLMTASNAFITGPGISATVIDHSRPMGNQEFQALRDRLKELQDRFQATRKANPGTNVWTPADTSEREEIRAKILKNPPNRTATPAMIETAIVRITVATNAAPGDREIRLGSLNALSNPMKFCIGELPEVTKLSAKPANPDFDKYLEKLGGRPALVGTPKYEVKVNLPATINGQIMPGGVDRYRFYAAHGQHLIIAANARTLIPYLADAVPGWFEAVLTILDSKGREVASAERYHFHPDPVIHFEVPANDDYTVEIHDSIFRGREDFVYRLTIGELPFVTGVYPLGGRAGEKTSVTLTGWNLPEKKIRVDNSTAAPGVVSLPGEFYNSVPFAVDDLPECAEREPNDSQSSAQVVTLPVIINGHIGQPGEQDVYKFEGRAGQKIVAEVLARRLDSPLDSFLRLTDAGGKQLAFNDDFEDKGAGLDTHHADSYLAATLQVDGTYFIHITDTQSAGGPDYAYRLRLSEPRPDFALRVVPSSLNLRPGMSASVTVFALRRDGFTNAINLELKDAPWGFSLSGARIAENQDKSQFTLKAPPEPSAWPVDIAIEGRATVNGHSLVRPAMPAEDMMQAFIYKHLVPSKELVVNVSGKPQPFLRDAFKVIGASPVKISSGGTAHVKITAPSGVFTERFKLQLDNPPDGLTLQKVSPLASGLELVVACDAEKIKPGESGNLILNVLPNFQVAAKNNKFAQRRTAAVATLPAIPYKIVAP